MLGVWEERERKKEISQGFKEALFKKSIFGFLRGQSMGSQRVGHD